jgi:hypothetical protein
MGLVAVHAEIRRDQLAALKNISSECGNKLSVNEQIRRAVDMYIKTGLVYTSPVKT